MSERVKHIKEIVIWGTLFSVMVAAPLCLALVGHTKEYRGFWIEFGVALGFIAIALMGLQFVLTARFKNIAVSFGTDALLNFHRQAGYVAYGFVLGHVVVLIAANTGYFSFFDPRVNAPRAGALSLVIVLITLLVLLTIWREKFKIAYEWWRLSHGIFAFMILMIGLAHILMVGFYVSELWMQVVWITMTGIAMYMLVHIRVLKPYKMSKRPYRVNNVRQAADKVWTIELIPEGHEGMTFNAGQFAWITLDDTPYSKQQHPFTLASGEIKTDRYLFTIKELGDFTSTIKNMEKGQPAYLEGPYGAFTLPDETDDVFFVVGGIGITPMISMLRTMRDRGDQREVTLLYGNVDVDTTIFRDELEELEIELNLKLVHILENPPEDWEGHSGFITPEIIGQHLPENRENVHYYVCGPEPLMDMAEITLKEKGVPFYRVHSERFNIV